MNPCSRSSPEASRFTAVDTVSSPANSAADVDVHPAMMDDMDKVEVVVAHGERATVRVGDVLLKIDSDQTRTDVEVEAMAMVPVPTPEILCCRPPVHALAAQRGTALGRLGKPSPGRCATRRWRHGPVGASTSSHRGSTASATGSSPTTSFRPTWSRATVGSPRLHSGRGHRCSLTATCRSLTSSSTVTRSPASSTSPRRVRATHCSTSPSSRSDTRSTLATSSPATAPSSTATSSARGGRCEAGWRSAGWPSTASAHLRRCPRSLCSDPGRETVRAHCGEERRLPSENGSVNRVVRGVFVAVVI